MSSVAVLFRYSDFVYFLGGAEGQLGMIVGAGMFGALAMRFLQGVGIDRYGPGRVWRASLLIYTLAAFGHLLVTRVDGVGIYAARILLTTGMAGSFGASLAYISLRAPQTRMAEMIGMLGTSGFLGLALGPTFGDWLMSGQVVGREQIVRMFLWAAGLSSVSLVFTFFATRQRVQRKRRRPPLWAILRRYHPGVVLLVGVGMGVALGLPSSFLRAYTAELEIERIKTFFIIYAATALAVRIGTRRLADQIGVRPVILWGLSTAAVAMLSFLLVSDRITLAIPAILMGAAHALLFPAAMAGGNSTFPIRYRGTATVLMLAMFDVGNMVGQPAAGGIIHGARQVGLPAYPAMFTTMAVFLGVAALWYGIRSLSRR